ncbi:hypothetical protein MB46_16000 [Arthrobacter alpinus]|uniref:META domain-containing protein n=1 Tax=Arthrobacter alpinus TaxID=656366 RepID=UPI0005CAE453|nr:META domain-containing protein [Arthrobacter alpinus]ALV46772.1 hypothetical protein MB46_16000 [Arthrobacter alpinus]
MKRLAALAGSLLLALTISSCGATTGPVGTWGDGYNTDKLPYLEMSLAAEHDPSFDQAGFITGSDGCNRLTGQWFLAQGKLSFSQFGSTTKACEDIDTWLSKTAGATLEGDVLTLTDASGAVIGTLDRRN